jgi:transposase-like protein
MNSTTENTTRPQSMSENVRKCPIAPDDLNERGASLNERQRAAIDMLLAGRSCAAVAQALEVDRRTLYRWRQEEPFRFELEQRRGELWQDAADRLRGMVHASLDVLERQLADRYDRARFTAATAVLRLAGLRKVVPPDAEQ